MMASDSCSSREKDCCKSGAIHTRSGPAVWGAVRAKAGSISRACLTTSHPSILPNMLMSVTSAPYLVLPTFNKVIASSLDAAMAGRNQPR